METPDMFMLKNLKSDGTTPLARGEIIEILPFEHGKASIVPELNSGERISLAKTDWDFKNVKTRKDINSIHPYPAKFIPEIPRKLIELYSPPESTFVLDPFCGSGTTLVEAITVGFDSIGVDVNPLACLISRVKTTPLPKDFCESASQIVEKAKTRMLRNDYEIPAIPNLDHWFNTNSQKALATLRSEINSVDSQSLTEALQVALSSIIVRVSRQESDTRYAAIENDISVEEVYDAFSLATNRLYQRIGLFWNNMDICLGKRKGKATVLNKDILSVEPEDLPSNVGLVVTSPPYPNAYEYWLYHKYRMYWLGMEPKAVLEHEIGARPHYFKTKPQDEHDFEIQMAQVFNLLSHVMILNGKACFLLGRSIIHGRIIDNAALLQRAAKSNGFALEDSIDRSILSNHKSFNPKHGNITKEAIMVFSLRGKQQ
jgi:site-specific DNA-methyltransferase (cytosine-N4-specific)